MRRALAVAAIAAAALALPASAAPPDPGTPGGRCDGIVDTMCRSFTCGPDDLDCGMIPPCLVWTYRDGCVA